MLQYKKVHEDARGEISILYDPNEKDDKEIAFLRTNAGYARGGCIHRINDETAIVAKGKVKYYIDGKELYAFEKDIIFIPKSTSHYFISLTDSIIIEFGATISEKQEKDPETKKIVDKINEEAVNDKKNS